MHVMDSQIVERSFGGILPANGLKKTCGDLAVTRGCRGIIGLLFQQGERGIIGGKLEVDGVGNFGRRSGTNVTEASHATLQRHRSALGEEAREFQPIKRLSDSTELVTFLMPKFAERGPHIKKSKPLGPKITEASAQHESKESGRYG